MCKGVKPIGVRLVSGRSGVRFLLPAPTLLSRADRGARNRPARPAHLKSARPDGPAFREERPRGPMASSVRLGRSARAQRNHWARSPPPSSSVPSTTKRTPRRSRNRSRRDRPSAPSGRARAALRPRPLSQCRGQDIALEASHVPEPDAMVAKSGDDEGVEGGLVHRGCLHQVSFRFDRRANPARCRSAAAACVDVRGRGRRPRHGRWIGFRNACGASHGPLAASPNARRTGPRSLRSHCF